MSNPQSQSPSDQHGSSTPIQPHVRIIVTELSHGRVEPPPVPVAGKDAASVLAAWIGRKDREHFAVAHLSAQYRVSAIETVAIGILTTALVHPREVFKAAILNNSAAIIVGHNHPSGDLTPSPDDSAVHRGLVAAGELLGIPVLDFVIVHANRWRSLDQPT